MAEYAKKNPSSDAAQFHKHLVGAKPARAVLNDHRLGATAQAFQLSAELPDQRAVSVQRKASSHGLPDQLKTGIESLSGMSMDHVRVHYNSAKPAQLHAHAYAQGSTIHLAPGQAHHLPHEAWHVVQQAQGRVKPTMQMKAGVPVNDDSGLEREADLMGAKALAQGKVQRRQYASVNPAPTYPAFTHYAAPNGHKLSTGVVQGRWPSVTELVMGGLGVVAGGLIAAGTAATAPVTLPALATGMALGGVVGGVTGTVIDYARETGASATPVTTSKTKAKRGSSGGSRVSSSSDGKQQNLKPKISTSVTAKNSGNSTAVTADVIRMIAKNTENLVASKGAAKDRPKRAIIFKDYAKQKGYNLTSEQLEKVEKAWKGEVFADEPRAPAVLPSRGAGVMPRVRAAASSAAAFDYNTAYAANNFLLTWVKKPDSDGTINLHGQGSFREHQYENQARAYARQGKIQDAIDELEQAVNARESNLGGQLAHNSGHQKAISYLRSVITALEAYK